MEKPFKPTKAYWRAYKALYGDVATTLQGTTVKIAPTAPIKARRRSEMPSEDQEQILVIAWCQKHHVRCHHSPNGGSRDFREAVKFKRMGVSPGFPDLVIPYARHGYHMLLVEMKRLKGGVLSDSQKDWRDFLIQEGYAWYEAKGHQECIKIIKDYLGFEQLVA